MDLPMISKNPDGNICWAFGDIVRRSPKNKKEELRKLAEMGCTEAMVHLGVMFVDGDDAEREMASALFRDAADAGDDMGMRNLGYMHAIGLCVEKDKTKAVEWYRKAAEAGNAKAQCNLGVMYDHGNGVERDAEEAVRWFRMSSENGYSRGMTNYGEHLLSGDGIGKDEKEAARQFALSGSPRANHRLAKMYLEGIGVEKDIMSAIALLEMSASKGYAKAMMLLGAIIEIDYEERAYDLYRQAAAKGNEDAVSRLNELGLSIPERIPRKRRKKVE